MKVVLAVLLVTLALAEARSSSSFADYKAKHRKQYNGSTENAARARIWSAAKSKIDAHNALFEKGQVSYTLEDNPLADMTEAEFNRLKGAVKRAAPRNAIPFDSLILDRQLPTAVNLTASTCMPAIKNQGQCGSCWAFSAVNPLEYQRCRKTGKLVLLSEQQLVSCSSAYGNSGCNGGDYALAWNYINKTTGITNSTVYPYSSGPGTTGTCTFKTTTAVAKVRGYITVYRNETAMQQALVTYGPLSVAVWVNNNFQLYATGVYKDTTCPNDGTVNHAVNVVGYGTHSTGGAYWIVRNSWGQTWGQRGYILMARGVNQCGIASWAEVPLLG